ncbi:MAG: hypothetical protein ND866_24900 [Pyrinomonadaceae bacterium]|nr:hypothetical protein [Pyrinomonadaceae bacterium]
MNNKICVAIVLIILGANSVFASRCLALRNVSEELKASVAVFSGHVVAAEYQPVSGLPGWPEGIEVLVIKFSVERWWKSSGTDEVLVYSGVGRWPDGHQRIFAHDFTFEVGEKYLVYAFGNEGKLGASICGRTAKLGDAAEDVTELGEGKLPDKSAPLVTTQPNKGLQRTRR